MKTCLKQPAQKKPNKQKLNLKFLNHLRYYLVLLKKKKEACEGKQLSVNGEILIPLVLLYLIHLGKRLEQTSLTKRFQKVSNPIIIVDPLGIFTRKNNYMTLSTFNLR